jgi:hypothetical protein
VAVFRVNQETGVVKKRTANRRLKRFPSMSGFLVVNDGVGIAEDLARAIARKNAPFREAPPSIEVQRASHAQPLESETSKAPQIKHSTSKRSDKRGVNFGKAWLKFVSRLKSLQFFRGSKTDSSP